MPITTADIQYVAPEFRSAPSITADDYTRVISDVEAQVNDNFLGAARGKQARIYLAAHLLAVSRPELSQSQRVRAYEDKGQRDAGGYGLTRFGREYLRIIRQVMAASTP